MEETVNNIVNLLRDEDIDFAAIADIHSDEQVKPVTNWIDEVNDELDGAHDLGGDKLPWESAGRFAFRPGEITLWGGQNGSFKSMVTGLVTSWLVRDESRALIASMEMKPRKTIARMMRQTLGVYVPTDGYRKHYFDWAKDRVWIYDSAEQVPVDNAIGLGVYGATVLGCQHIVIDSLMKVDLYHDDHTAQKNFVDRLCQVAKRYDVHVHLITHSRKPMDDSGKSTKYEIHGSSMISNLADNVIMVSKNIHKFKAVEEAELSGSQVDEKYAHQADVNLGVEKQRNGEWEGSIKLWFNKSNLQFDDSPKLRTLHFIPPYSEVIT